MRESPISDTLRNRIYDGAGLGLCANTTQFKEPDPQEIAQREIEHKKMVARQHAVGKIELAEKLVLGGLAPEQAISTAEDFFKRATALLEKAELQIVPQAV